ncbi:MAG: glycosyltransferase [Pseudomonadota bacterium]|nr:glycosyltransferase [Pseudomonadota bacterium]
MTYPSVSVVIPTYNRATFLGAAVASIRAQTYACAEIVIVDDGSTDNTAEVIKELGAGINYIRQVNAGPAAARNLGISRASGDLIAFLDTDDRWLPDKIALQVEVLRREPSVALVSADMAIEDERGVLCVASNFARRGLQTFFHDLDGRSVPGAPSMMLKINFINTSAVLARRDVLLAMKGFDTRLRFGEDLELWLRIAARHGVACIPSVQEIRVEHAHNVTKSIEPMLFGYVRLAEVIREWASEQMLNWGLNANRYVAESLSDLGYWYFSQNQMKEARHMFIRSLREHPTLRAFLYFAASTMPPFLISIIRNSKSIKNKTLYINK